jgi:hypothetical protein
MAGNGNDRMVVDKRSGRQGRHSGCTERQERLRWLKRTKMTVRTGRCRGDNAVGRRRQARLGLHCMIVRLRRRDDDGEINVVRA